MFKSFKSILLVILISTGSTQLHGVKDGVVASIGSSASVASRLSGITKDSDVGLASAQQKSFLLAAGGAIAAYALFKVGQVGYRAIWMTNLYRLLEPAKYLVKNPQKQFYFFKWRVNSRGGNYWQSPKDVRDADHKDIMRILIKDLDIPVGVERSVFIFTDRSAQTLNNPVFTDIKSEARDVYDGRVLDLPTMNAVAGAINSEVVMLRDYLLSLREASVWTMGDVESFNSAIEDHLLDVCGASVSSLAQLDKLDKSQLATAKIAFLKKYPCWSETFSFKRHVARLFFDTAVAYARATALKDKLLEEIRNRRAPGSASRVPVELGRLQATFATFLATGAAGFTATDLNTLKVEAEQGYARLLAAWPAPSIVHQQIINDLQQICTNIDAAIDAFNLNKPQQAFSIIMMQKALYDRTYVDLVKEF